jgi:hypothetical protein
VIASGGIQRGRKSLRFGLYKGPSGLPLPRNQEGTPQSRGTKQSEEEKVGGASDNQMVVYNFVQFEDQEIVEPDMMMG